jgi:acyl-CoA thioesterase FadM
MSKPIDIDERKASFGLRQEAWSLKQKTVVARCTSVQVMYDFEKLKKGVMTGEVRRALDCISERSGTA